RPDREGGDHTTTNTDTTPEHAESTARKENTNPTTTRGKTARACRPRHRPPTGELTDADKAAIRARVLALPPLTDDQIDALCDVIINARIRRDTANPTRPDKRHK